MTKFLHDGTTVIYSCAIVEVIHWVSKVSAEGKVANLLSFCRIVDLFISATVTLAGVCITH